jgi:List-Bact-rpt repeat protein
LTAVFVAALLLGAGTASANFTVDDADDPAVIAPDGVCDAPGPDTCTLREALSEEDSLAGAGTITFNIPGNLPINIAGELSVQTSMTIDGNGSGTGGTVIDGGNAFRIFLVSNGAGPSVTFKDLRLQNGRVTNPGGGGAAIRSDASLNLDNVTATGNQITGTGQGNGGAIFVPDTGETLSLTDSTISGNTISSASNNIGAGVYGGDGGGTVSLTRTTVSGNQITAGTSASGGGIYTGGGLSVIDSTISGNSIITGMFGTDGGGIYANPGGTKTVTNSTISTNTAGTGLGGIGGGIEFNGSAAVTNSTFALNTSPTLGADIAAGTATTVTLKNDIMGSAGACGLNGGAFASTVPGNNIDNGTSCGLGTTNGNQQNVTSGMLALGPLQLNSPGATMTHALGPTSVAIDAATPDCGGLTADQRGVSRPQPSLGGCDVGAYESIYRTLTVSNGGGGTVSGGAINCQPTCSTMVPDGKQLTLTATPASGFAFSGWSGGGCAGTGTCNVTLDANKTVAATFTALPPPSTGGGSAPAATPAAGPTGLRAAALKKCKKRHGAARAKCKKKANLLPL